MKDLSVIIPIYNTPREALERCFRSAEALKALDVEILLIDDGSEETVGGFCKAYAENHAGFRYIRKENGGVSSARNRGIEEAQGRYITFVDADDSMLCRPLIEALAGENRADLMLFDMQLIQRGSQSVWYAFDCAGGALTREQVLYQLLTASSISGPVAKLYRKELLQKADLRFDTEFIAGEDWMFVTAYVMVAESFWYCKEPSYRYFRDDATGQGRIARYPDQMLSNQLQRYARKQALLATENWQLFTPEKIQFLASVELIENLFNMAADLLLVKLYTRERKELIRTAAAKAGQFLDGSAPRKTKIKLWVLTSCPAALGVLGHLRAAYLKRK